PRGYPGQV
nr:Chain P, Proteinase-activated receptor 4 [synthetic construct]2ZPK_Q Chain Q, Proteinase-activated receptor 4 [synthetic construct]5XCQ_C Chain C, C8 peptide [Homo sapiens]5XCR_C Chain C, C8 peptide [Homo sapiens]5XCR_F Chain F, C8 peptide [Homo sapiens]5XCT_C Chain C, C8 peptide [Homo sapiens]